MFLGPSRRRRRHHHHCPTVSGCAAPVVENKAERAPNRNPRQPCTRQPTGCTVNSSRSLLKKGGQPRGRIIRQTQNVGVIFLCPFPTLSLVSPLRIPPSPASPLGREGAANRSRPINTTFPSNSSPDPNYPYAHLARSLSVSARRCRARRVAANTILLKARSTDTTSRNPSTFPSRDKEENAARSNASNAVLRG